MKIQKFLKDMLDNQYGIESADRIENGYKTERKSSFRVNTIKSLREEIISKLEAFSIEYEEVKWYKDAFIISNQDEEKLRSSDLYEDGKIYFQSLSSMIPPLVLGANENENILDMAAAPGGKTTQLFAISEGKALITACEKNKIRAERLKYNLDKQGANRVNVMMQDARKLDDFFSFDKVLLDAPCSGSGTLNLNDEKQINGFKEELVKRSVATQKEMLDKALKVLKVGHEMVYSTCSILKAENEGQLKRLIDSGKIEIVPIDEKIFEGLETLKSEIEGTLCVCPNELYEGFYIAKFKKIK